MLDLLCLGVALTVGQSPADPLPLAAEPRPRFSAPLVSPVGSPLPRPEVPGRSAISIQTAPPGSLPAIQDGKSTAPADPMTKNGGAKNGDAKNGDEKKDDEKKDDEKKEEEG